MKILNKRKLLWVLRELRKGELSIYRIAKQQGVSTRWVRKLRERYGDTPLIRVKTGTCGRPPKPIDPDERKLILDTYSQAPLGAVKMELFLSRSGVWIPHNRIHRILCEAGKAKPVGKKIRRRKWVRYERRHPNSLWHGDYCDIGGVHVIAFIDDATRFIVGCGAFDSATTENALRVLDSAISRHGLPRQVMTDHGAQFCSDEEKAFRFTESLRANGIEHIMAKVKRPQSNGKIERWFGTIKRLLAHFGGDLGRAVECYNSLPHLSLDASPAEVFFDKKRNA